MLVARRDPKNQSIEIKLVVCERQAVAVSALILYPHVDAGLARPDPIATIPGTTAAQGNPWTIQLNRSTFQTAGVVDRHSDDVSRIIAVDPTFTFDAVAHVQLVNDTPSSADLIVDVGMVSRLSGDQVVVEGSTMHGTLVVDSPAIVAESSLCTDS